MCSLGVCEHRCVCACVYVHVCMPGMGMEREPRIPEPAKGEGMVCGREWDTTRKNMLTFLVGIEPTTRWWAPMVLTIAPHPHTHSPSPHFHDIYTHTDTHTPAHTRTHTSIV